MRQINLIEFIKAAPSRALREALERGAAKLSARETDELEQQLNSSLRLLREASKQTETPTQAVLSSPAIASAFEKLATFLVVNVVGRRAEQLMRGARPKLAPQHVSFHRIALEEFANDLILWKLIAVGQESSGSVLLEGGRQPVFELTLPLPSGLALASYRPLPVN